MEHIETDVVIVGSRVAGAATALLLARQGLDVVVVDRATELGDTLSTHAIARGGVVQLHRWGVLDAIHAAGTPQLRSITFHVDGAVIERPVKERHGVDHMVAPRRRVLDPVLAEAAADAGADIRLGHSLAEVRRTADGRPDGIVAVDTAGRPLTIDARYVVGADGWRSRVAALVGAELLDHVVPDTACLLTYFAGIPWDGLELYAAEQGYAGVFPTNDGGASIWAIEPASVVASRETVGEELLREQLAAIAPSLAERLRDAHRTDPMRVALRFPTFLREAAGPGWALVGDAGYHRDAITGHGITDALRDAELLARALGQALAGDTSEREALATYAAARDAALGPIHDVTKQMAAFPPLARFVELQIELSAHLEAEAEALAAYPDLRAVSATAA